MLLSDNSTIFYRLAYSAPFFVSALLMVVVALFAYRRRKFRGAWYLSLLCLSCAIWATFEGMRYIGLDLETDRLVTYAQYLGVVPLSGFALLVSLAIFGYEHWISRPVLITFGIISGILIALVWTDPLHHQVYSRFYMIDSAPFPMRAIERGAVWWIVTSYLYLLATALGVLLFHTVVTANTILRSQASVILAAMAIVLVVNLIYITGHSPVTNMDITPLSFILVAISMAWGFFRYNLLDILPIARAEIFQGLNDPILVLDQNNRILDLNPAAESMLGIHAADSIGQNIADLSGNQPTLAQLLRHDREAEARLCKNGSEKFYDVVTSTLNDRHGMQIGRIITFHDNTERKLAAMAERERERLQGVLEMAGAVCHDLSQPVMAILGYVELILTGAVREEALDANVDKLTQQAEKLSDMTKKLMGITRYETKAHQGNQIIDIDKASSSEPSENER